VILGFAASKETRQLFALDRETNLVVQLPDGAADLFREGCRSGRYVCPIESCDSPQYTAVGGPSRRHHFRHSATNAGGHAPETWLHEMAKHVLAQHLSERYPTADVYPDTKAVDGGQRPDVLVELDGRRIAFEIQYSSITIDAWLKRHRGYEAAGIHDVWLFGNRPPHFRQARTLPNDFAIALSQLLWVVHRALMHVRFIGPDALAVATVMIESGDRYDRALERFKLTLDPLETCELVDGRFVVPADALEIEARARRAEEQRAFDEETRQEREEWEKRRLRREAEETRRQRDAGKIAAFKERRRREQEEAWGQAEQRFLELVGLTETPAILAREIPGDRGIWMHPAHWHAQLYWEWIHGRVGSSFSFKQVGRRWYRIQGDRGKRGVTIAPTAFLWALKRRGFVDFDAAGHYIESKILVRADLTDPPAQRVVAPGGTLRDAENARGRVIVAANREIVSELGEFATPRVSV
jgi:hypothetical protein